MPRPNANVLWKYLVPALLLAAWACLAFSRFGDRETMELGFTPQFVDIAVESRAQGRYAGHVAVDAAAAGSPAWRETITEVRREPLYPALLMLFDALGQPVPRVTYLQLGLVLASLYLMYRFALPRYGPGVAVGFLALAPFLKVPSFYASVLYPYAFQLFALTVAFVALAAGCANRRIGLVLLAGVATGAAFYERGAYLFLPLFVGGALFICARRLNVPRPWVAAYLACCYLVALPWLVRNAGLGVTGMSQMAGYSLGFTYGDLPGGEDSDYRRAYDRSLTQYGNDVGTTRFMSERTLAGDGSYRNNDRRVASIAVQKMKANPGAVAKRIAMGLAKFPCRAVGAPMAVAKAARGRSPLFDFFRARFGQMPSPIELGLDVLFFALGGGAVLYGVRRNDAACVVVTATLAYTVLFSTTIVHFDERYRGVLDLMFALYAAVGVKLLIDHRRRQSAASA